MFYVIKNIEQKTPFPIEWGDQCCYWITKTTSLYYTFLLIQLVDCAIVYLLASTSRIILKIGQSYSAKSAISIFKSFPILLDSFFCRFGCSTTSSATHWLKLWTSELENPSTFTNTVSFSYRASCFNEWKLFKKDGNHRWSKSNKLWTDFRKLIHSNISLFEYLVFWNFCPKLNFFEKKYLRKFL